MKIEKDRKGLVRGKVTVRQKGTFDPINAFTFWHRHDEPDLENKLQREIDLLVNFYLRQCKRSESALIGVEWMDYRR